MRLLILGKRSACRWCVGLAILVALVVGVLCSWPSSGRRIQGRTLVEWLQQLDANAEPKDFSEAAAVIRSLNATQMEGLAELLERDWSSGPDLSHRLNRILDPVLDLVGLPGHLFGEPGFRSYCDLALGGVRVLGTNAAPIVPRLVRDLRVYTTSYPAASALCTVGGAAVVPVVEMLASGTNSGLPWRWPFAHGLQAASPSDAAIVVPALVRALQDPEVEVQIYATQALKKFRGHEREFVPQILLNLRSPVNRVREISAETLWAMRRKEAIPQLKPLLSDPDPSVRAAVKRALQDLEH